RRPGPPPRRRRPGRGPRGGRQALPRHDQDPEDLRRPRCRRRAGALHGPRGRLGRPDLIDDGGPPSPPLTPDPIRTALLRGGSPAKDDGRVNRLASLAATAAVAVLSLSCSSKPKPGPAPAQSAGAAVPVATASATAVAEPEEPAGNAEHGQELIKKFECNRCHEGTGQPAPTLDKACFTCHQKIISGEFKSPKAAAERWHERVLDLQDVPSLTSSQKRFKRTWVVSFLMSPYDLRPRLKATMPRLAMTREEARDIAAYLAAPDDPAAKPDFSAANPTRGRKLMEDNGCPSCHLFTGVPPLEGTTPYKMEEKALASAMQLAPDLRNAR